MFFLCAGFGGTGKGLPENYPGVPVAPKASAEDRMRYMNLPAGPSFTISQGSF